MKERKSDLKNINESRQERMGGIKKIIKFSVNVNQRRKEIVKKEEEEINKKQTKC